MMMFLRVGTPVAAFPELGIFAREPGGSFSKWGWTIGEFGTFQSWVNTRDSARPERELNRYE